MLSQEFRRKLKHGPSDSKGGPGELVAPPGKRAGAPSTMNNLLHELLDLSE